MQISFQKVFFVTASIIGLFAILILAKTILIPISFALLVAFILFPVARKIESWGANEMVSAASAIIGLLLIISGTILLFSNQIMQLSEYIYDFKGKILNVFADATLYLNQNVGFLPELERGEILNKIKTWVNDSAGSLLSKTFSSTASIGFGLIISIVFTFLILIYRQGLIKALVAFFPQNHKHQAFKMFQSVQKVGQQYLFGMTIIITILGFVNSIGLWIIGIDNPFLFGFLAALLALIPYAGTFLGAAIPILYSLITYDSFWMPITIAIYFWFVQFVESNFLTPKIVGGNLNINALTAILSIIIGSMVWGVAGMIVFLPFAAMFKVVCSEYDELKPIALLIGESNYKRSDDSDNVRNKWIKKIKSWFSNSSSDE